MDRGSTRRSVRRRGLVAWVAVLVACTLLAACGPSGSEPASADGQELSVLLSHDWAAAQVVVDAVRDFEAEHQGVRVQLQGLPFAQILDTVAAGIDSGEPPDVVQEHAFAAAARGLAEPLDDLWSEQLDPEEFLPGAVTDVTWGDGRYGMPLDVNTMVLFANPDAGVAIPEELQHFDDLVELSRAARAEGLYGLALAASSWTTYGWIRANGGEILQIDDDGQPTFTFDDPATVEALEQLGRLVEEDLALPPETRDETSDAYALFSSGATLFQASGTWELAQLQSTVDWNPKVLAVPHVAGRGTVLGGSSLFIPRGSDQRDLAVEFMLHLTSDVYAQRLLEEEGRLPARNRLYDDEYFDNPGLAVVRQELEHSEPLLLPAFPMAALAFKEAYEGVLTGAEDAADALAEAQRISERHHPREAR